MPLTLTLTEGVLPKGTEKATFSRLAECMLKWHHQSDNAGLKSNIIGTIHVLPKEHTFAGCVEETLAIVEWKVPSIMFPNAEIRRGYFAEATNIVHEASLGKHPKERIWVNVVYAPDGAWGIAGNALTNAQLMGADAAVAA